MREYNNLEYHHGFNNHFESESEKNSLPKSQNNPQKCNYGLYAEQLSGTAFTAPKNENKRSWMYKLRPSVSQNPLEQNFDFNNNIINNYDNEDKVTIIAKQLRWKPLHQLNSQKFKKEKVSFIEGLFSFCGNGNPSSKKGISILGYWCNKSMKKEVFYSADGDFLIVPQKGTLFLITEFGKLKVEPQEIVVIPRGIKYSVEINEESSGWVCEIFNGHLELPERGPIGANGLANERDFEIPKAFYEDLKDQNFSIIAKFSGKFFLSKDNFSPFDTVAWHGNYYPYKYDLRKFNTIGSISYDHPDPCIFTVLTCQSEIPGTAILDLAIFPPRHMVAENTFRPPYYHRNIMSEFMGNIFGTYDAKEEGFTPGSSSLHSIMTPHGPEKEVFDKASNCELKPIKLDNTMSFMFETSLFLNINKNLIGKNSFVQEDEDYCNCWKGLDSNFKK